MNFFSALLVFVLTIALSESITFKQINKNRKALGFSMKEYAKYLYEKIEEMEDADAVTEKDIPEEPTITPAPEVDSLAQAFIDAHDAARAGEDTASPALPNVGWDSQLAAKCAVNVGKCSMGHDSGDFRKRGTSYNWVGQNLYMRSCSIKNTPEEYAQKAVDAWMGEKKDWNVSTKTCNKAWYYCAHYTQVVWRASVSIGCAIKTCGRSTYVCCNYGPGGNWNGETPY